MSVSSSLNVCVSHAMHESCHVCFLYKEPENSSYCLVSGDLINWVIVRNSFPPVVERGMPLSVIDLE